MWLRHYLITLPDKQMDHWTINRTVSTVSTHTRHPQLGRVTCGWMTMMRFFMQRVLYKISSFHETPLGILYAFLKTHTHTQMFLSLKTQKHVVHLTFLLFYACISSSLIIVRLIFSSGHLSNVYNGSNEVHVALGWFLMMIPILTFLNNNQ